MTYGKTAASLSTCAILTIALIVLSACEPQSPQFVDEPPSHVSFLNSTGTAIRCRVSGNPLPDVRWVLGDGQPVAPLRGIRDIRDDGTLTFYPFAADKYRAEVHDTVYRCTASNVVGVIASREVRIRAALKQLYEVGVLDQYSSQGSTAVLRCYVPPSVREFVSVITWIVDDNVSISTETEPKERFVALPTGELYVHSVTSDDGKKSFRCRILDRLSGEKMISSNTGRIILTDAVRSVPPKIIDSKPKVWVARGKTTILPCAAHGKPTPHFQWYKSERGKPKKVFPGDRIKQIVGILVMRNTSSQDAGRYLCKANNSLGADTSETELIVTSQISVLIEPHHLVVLSGGSATLTCSVEGYPVDAIVWMKDFRPVAAEGRIDLIGNNVLHISRIWREDQGMYQCFAYSGSTTEQAAAQITVSDAGPVIHEGFSDEILHPGNSTTLRCVVSGHPLPKITWTLDGHPVSKSQVTQTLSPDGHLTTVLNISGIKTMDGGNYACVATNNVGMVSHGARIQVYGSPFIRPMQNVTVFEGDTLVLICPAVGYPLNPITWQKGGIELPISGREKVSPNGTLVIEEAQKDFDQGQYMCRVSNSQGKSYDQSVTVTVSTPPKIIPFDFPPRVREGTAAVLTCTVNQGDHPFQIEWTKNGKPLTKDGVSVQTHEMFSILAISLVAPQHAGNYTCLARNLGGFASHSARLTVDVPPKWQWEPQNNTVILGHSVTIDCSANGSPAPKITWKKAPGKVPKDFVPIYNSFIFAIYGNGSLAIRDASEATAGFYLCQASNGVGAGLSKLIFLTVLSPPVIQPHQSLQSVRLGDTLEMECTARGDLPMDATWIKDGAPIIKNQNTRYIYDSRLEDDVIRSVLLISNAERNDSGVFWCRVGNDYGVNEINFQVVVQETPSAPDEIQSTPEGRSIFINWKEPFNGHNPITRYWIQYASKNEEIYKNLSTPKTSATISNLSPATEYLIKISSENAIGKSSFSKTFSVQTTEEAPDGPPQNVKATATGPNSIKVSWQAPKIQHLNGVLRGYSIAYRAGSTNDPPLIKEVGVNEKNESEVHLTNLQRSVEYVVNVQAFNSKGKGPQSEDVFVKTLADVPPIAPTLRVLSATESTVTLQWTYKRPFGSPVIECMLYLQPDHGKWKDIRIPSANSTYTLTHLECGTRYKFYMVSFNSVGRSEPSEIVTARTSGAAPLSPPKDFLEHSASSTTLNLLAWKNGGCPITRFSIKIRKKHSVHWITDASNVPSSQSKHVLHGLLPAHWYELKVIAYSSGGATEAVYNFLTPNATAEVKTTETAMILERSGRAHLELSVLVPVISSIIIIVVIILVGCVMCHRSAQCGIGF